jgi:uncharacterized protein YqeY
MIRERLAGDLKAAIRGEDAIRAAALRLISAAIKDRDIAARAGDNLAGVSDEEIRQILTRMIAQREASATGYEEAGQLELAEQERQEIVIIRDYLPRQMSEREMRSAIDSAIETTGARSVRDISRVMAHLKANHTGQMDFTRACATLKDAFR